MILSNKEYDELVLRFVYGVATAEDIQSWIRLVDKYRNALHKCNENRNRLLSEPNAGWMHTIPSDWIEREE